MQLETPMPIYAGVETRSRILVSAELIAYIAIPVFALVLRLANLDIVPLMSSETHNALAAWRMVSANAAGVDLISNSPILFDAQSVSFGLLGGSEFAARIATVIASTLLILLPALFRSLLGKTTAILASVLLACSPVLLVTGRTSSADVWALLLAGLSLWGYWQAARAQDKAQQGGWATVAIASFAALIFLSGVGGVALALILVIAGAITVIWQRRSDLLEEAPTVDLLAPLRASSGLALVVAALVVIALGTGFLIYPAGLSSIGASFGASVRAVIQPKGIIGYGALVSLFYEPFMWALAAAGLFARRYRFTAVDRFLLAWVLVGIVVSLFVVDGSADHALWISVPLAVLAARALEQALVPDNSTIFIAAPTWSRWLIATSVIGVFCVFTLALQSAGRALIQAPEGTLASANFQPDSIILLLIALLFLVIGFFLFGSLWGNRVAWQGIAIGLALFGGLTSLGGGWNVAVTNAGNPVAFWHSTATDDDTILLRQTLFEVAKRQSSGLPLMPITVMSPPDGVIAWLLRDFTNADFVSDVGDAVGDEVVLLPGSLAAPELGSSYVGQDFVVSRSWDMATMNLIDLPGWWTQQQARSAWTGEERYNLWLRQDVYEGIPVG